VAASLLGPKYFLLFAFDCPVMSPLDNPFDFAQGRHIFPLLLTNDTHSLIQRLPDLRLLLLQFSNPLAFLQAPQVFPTWLTPATIFNTFITITRHSDDGGARDDKEKRGRHALWVPKPTCCHWFVIQSQSDRGFASGAVFLGGGEGGIL
jgi:hypothetical protein